MTCLKCGAELVEDGFFCPDCGAPISILMPQISTNEAQTGSRQPEQIEPWFTQPPAQDTPESAPVFTPPDAPQNSPPRMPRYKTLGESLDNPQNAPQDKPNITPPQPPQQEQKPAAKPASHKKRGLVALAVASAIVILGAAAGFLVYQNTGARLVEKKVTLGQKYLAQLNYDAAIDSFNEAIGKDSKNEKAYIGLADAYTGKKDSEKVAGILQQGLTQLPGSATMKTRLIDTELQLGDVYIDNAQYDKALTTYQVVNSVSPGNQQATLGIAYAHIGLHDPDANHAEIQLVSADTSNYPTVRLYLKIVDTKTGESVNNLAPQAFALQERLQGGSYLAREVHSVEQLKGRTGIDISLVADKSDSMAGDSMTKIRNVMSKFVTNLDYSVGDKAEMIAFDTNVTQMCLFTGDVSLLQNGINNMYTSGGTALFDALVTAINHVRFQDGPQCVIAFTDGMDNASRINANDVIAEAQRGQIPVYIIGTGSDADENTLKNIARQTGGQYWFINDLTDLNDIYNTIYAEQKDMYVVEYQADESADPNAARDLSLSFKDAGYMESSEVSFTPKQPSTGAAGDGIQASQTSTSRYQLFVSNMPWEDAAQYCISLGGHLVTINSENEEAVVESMAQQAGISYVWLGGYTSYNETGKVFGHWVTGESFDFTKWCVNEPSKDDLDGTPERYLVLWNLPRLGGWSWNDTRNDPVSIGMYTNKLAFVCEFENK